MSMPYTVQPATPNDIPEMLKLIVDLAIYEKEPTAVTATPAMMNKALFEDKYAHAMIARDQNGQAVGYCIYFFTYSTWLGKPGVWVEDIYVSPEFRGHGLGKLFFGYIGEIAEAKGCGRVEWTVLKWNTPAIDFYEKRINSNPLNEWQTERVEGVIPIQGLAALKNEIEVMASRGQL